MRKYFYTDGKDKFGPFSEDELKRKNLSRETKIWHYGLDDWTSLSEIEELSGVTNSIPPELPTKTSLSKEFKKTKLFAGNRESIGTKQKLYKWLIGVVIALFVATMIYIKLRNTKEQNQYEAIAANSYETDFDFQFYVDKFYRDIGTYGIYPKKPKTTIVKFSKLDQMDNTTHIHGMSFGYDNDDLIEIYINPSTWASFNKSKRYYLMYHELAHDVLNVDDLSADLSNEGKLMYPAISDYESISMDDFIESSHALFEEVSSE